MLRRLSRKAVETLEFRGVLVLIALVAATILYFSLLAGHRPAEDRGGLPPVPPGEQPPPSRL